MWSHCIICSASLGQNEDLEEFSIGQRLAFDAGKGRLWVVCPRCERWNLAPIEQRWEAVEALERAFRDTPTRYSTAEIGLARLAGGLELVRIGDPIPGEFAAWRWGSRFGRRRRRLKSSVKRMKLPRVESRVAWAAGLALAPLAPVLAPLVVVGGIVSAPVILLSRVGVGWPVAPGVRHRVSRSQLRSGGITPSDVYPGWSVHLQVWEEVTAFGRTANLFRWREFSGEDAVRLARRALPLLNRRTPAFGTISEAVREISDHGGGESYLSHAAGLKPKWVGFRYYPKTVLLGMEMALFEVEERRALEGEMERLVAAWREAETMAAISDDLIQPKGWEIFRAQVRGAGAAPPEGAGRERASSEGSVP